MRYSLLLLSILTVMLPLFVSGQQAGSYRVVFTDKSNSPYTVSNPQAFLSSRALARRAAQGIPVTQQDLPVNPSYIQGVKTTGAVVVNRSKWFNSVVAQLQSPAQYAQLAALPYVDTLVYLAPPPVKIGGPDKFAMEMVPIARRVDAATEQTAVINYGLAANQTTMIQLDLLHDMGFTGQGMVIAVIDAGFTNVDNAAAFDSLWDQGRILGYKDFAEPGGNVFSAHSHGTMVLSIMGGNIPGMIVGTAPHASYWLLRSEIGSSEYLVEEDNWVAAAEFADSVGADIINSSLGYTTFYDSAQDHTYEDMDGNTTRVTLGADLAASRGILVVNSAGNSGGSSWNFIGAPADGDSVMAIGAVDAFGSYAFFSSQGPSYDGRVKPDVSAQGQGTAYADPWGNVNTGNGTSFSSPVMAGAAACLWQAHPGFSNMDIRQALVQSASQYSSPDSLLGYGIPNLAAASLLLGGNVLRPAIQELSLDVHLIGPTEMRVGYHGLNGRAMLSLSDLSGRELSSWDLRPVDGTGETIVRIPSLNQGIYLLYLQSGNGAVTTKVFIP